MSLPWSAVWGLESTEVQDWAGAALGKQQKLSHLTVVTPLPSYPPTCAAWCILVADVSGRRRTCPFAVRMLVCAVDK